MKANNFERKNILSVEVKVTQPHVGVRKIYMKMCLNNYGAKHTDRKGLQTRCLLTTKIIVTLGTKEEYVALNWFDVKNIVALFLLF